MRLCESYKQPAGIDLGSELGNRGWWQELGADCERICISFSRLIRLKKHDQPVQSLVSYLSEGCEALV